MADTAHFQIIYAGNALDNNEMDVRELAPALVAVADLLEEANNIVNGGSSKIAVNVHGSFKSGSFGIDFTVIQDIFQNVMKLFNSEGITAANNLLGLLGLKDVGKGLIALIKKLKGRKIKSIEKLDDNRVRIHIDTREKIDIEGSVLDLYKSQRVRDALDKVITRPLNRNGIEEFRSLIAGEKDPVIVRKEEKELFEIPLLDDELLGENVTEAYLQVVSLSFKEDNKWRFSRGENVFFASVEDAQFLGGINRNEIRFSKDDILKVRLLAKDLLTGNGIRTEYKVLEVLDHRSAARQLRLPMDEEEHDDD